MNTCKEIEPAESEYDAQSEANITQLGASIALTKSEQRTTNLVGAITLCGPAFLAKYVLHQSRVCFQSTRDLVNSLRRYRDELEANPRGESSAFSVGDLWSGLLWWKDEASWVGKAGVLSREEVTNLVRDTLTTYLAMIDRGLSNDEIACSVSELSGSPELALRLMRGVTCDNSSPNFRAVISYAVCEMGG